MPEEFTLSFAAVDIVLEDLKLGIAPPPFAVPRAAPTFDERAQVRGQVWDDLRRRGLARRDRPDGDVENALEVWARPETAIVVRARQTVDPPDIGFRGCAAHGLGVLSEQAADEIRFTIFKAEQLVGTMVGLLPPKPPLPLPEAVLTDEYAESEGDPLAAPRSQRDRAAARRFFTGGEPELLGTYELSVAPPRGKLSLVGSVQFFDMPDGRFAAFPAPHGSRLVGTDGSDIRRWLSDEISYQRR